MARFCKRLCLLCNVLWLLSLTYICLQYNGDLVHFETKKETNSLQDFFPVAFERKTNTDDLLREEISHKHDASQQTMDRLAKFRSGNLSKQCFKHGLIKAKLPWDFEAALKSGRFRKETRLFVSDQHKVIYCSIDGTGAEYLEKAFDTVDNSPGKAAEVLDRRLLWHYRNDSILHRVRNYYKVLVVRDPVRRIIDRFLKLSDWQQQKAAAAAERDLLMEKFLSEAEARWSYENLTKLDSFVKLLLKQPMADLDANRHWGSYNTLCDPCHVGYDFVGRFETLADDLEYVVKKSNVTNVHYRRSATDLNDTDAVEESFNNLSQGNMKLLVKRYELDYSLFGYLPT